MADEGRQTPPRRIKDSSPQTVPSRDSRTPLSVSAQYSPLCSGDCLRRPPLSPDLPCKASAPDTDGKTRLYLWFGIILLYFSPFVKVYFPLFLTKTGPFSAERVGNLTNPVTNGGNCAMLNGKGPDQATAPEPG